MGSPRRLEEEERPDQTQPCRGFAGTICYRSETMKGRASRNRWGEVKTLDRGTNADTATFAG
jgi:hypothetical protein